MLYIGITTKKIALPCLLHFVCLVEVEIQNDEDDGDDDDLANEKRNLSVSVAVQLARTDC